MKKILSLLLFLLFVLVSLSAAKFFEIKTLPIGLQKVKTTEKSSGKALWQSKHRTQKVEYDGKPFLYIEEDGYGIYGKDKEHKTWHSESYFIFEDSKLVPYQIKQVFKNINGKTVETINKFYDAKTKKVTCNINGKIKEIEFKKDIVDKEDLSIYLRNYPFEEKKDHVFHLLTHEPTLYKITVKYRGLETLDIQGKKVKCHKVEIIPDLGLLNLLGAFVPKTYFWFTADERHDFVRYEGLESGLGTPYIVIETATFSQ